jgi:hypothetical protein
MNAVPPKVSPVSIDFAAMVCAWVIMCMAACFFTGAYVIARWVWRLFAGVWQA